MKKLQQTTRTTLRSFSRNFFTIALMVALFAMAMPMSSVKAKEDMTPDTIEISNKRGKNAESFDTYSSKAEADEHPITYYANENDFPIHVKICPRRDIVDKYVFDSYGTKNVVGDYTPIAFYSNKYTYAKLIIEPYPTPKLEPSVKPCEPEKADEGGLLDQKLDNILDRLDRLNMCYTENTPYADEIKAFLKGEWDGSRRSTTIEDTNDGRISTREVFRREYIWQGTNLWNGETAQYTANVDYDGMLEIIPATCNSQDFTLAIGRSKGIIEQWSLLEKRDEWQLNNAETVTSIYPLGGDSTGSQALIYTNDAEGIEHAYSLIAGGEVTQLW